MFRKRVVQAAVCLMAVVTSVLVAAPPAHAATAFQVNYVHGGGTGAIATAVRGSYYWTNWSVVIVNPELYVKSGECGAAGFYGWRWDSTDSTWYLYHYDVDYWCNNTGVSQYISLGASIVLSGDSTDTKISRLTVEAEDTTHSGLNAATFYR